MASLPRAARSPVMLTTLPSPACAMMYMQAPMLCTVITRSQLPSNRSPWPLQAMLPTVLHARLSKSINHLPHLLRPCHAPEDPCQLWIDEQALCTLGNPPNCLPIPVASYSSFHLPCQKLPPLCRTLQTKRPLTSQARTHSSCTPLLSGITYRVTRTHSSFVGYLR